MKSFLTFFINHKFQHNLKEWPKKFHSSSSREWVFVVCISGSRDYRITAFGCVMKILENFFFLIFSVKRMENKYLYTRIKDSVFICLRTAMKGIFPHALLNCVPADKRGINEFCSLCEGMFLRQTPKLKLIDR